MAYVKSDRRSQRAFLSLRLAVLVALLALSTALGAMHQFQKGARPVGVDALCPFGAIEAAYMLLASGSLIERVSWSSYALLLATVLAALLFRRVFCGKICAFGTLQELFARLGEGLFRRRFMVPESTDKPARFVKYAILAGTVAASAIAGRLFIRPYDPWATYQHLLFEGAAPGVSGRPGRARGQPRRFAPVRSILLQIPLPYGSVSRLDPAGRLVSGQAERRNLHPLLGLHERVSRQHPGGNPRAGPRRGVHQLQHLCQQVSGGGHPLCRRSRERFLALRSRSGHNGGRFHPPFSRQAPLSGTSVGL